MSQISRFINGIVLVWSICIGIDDVIDREILHTIGICLVYKSPVSIF